MPASIKLYNVLTAFFNRLSVAVAFLNLSHEQSVTEQRWQRSPAAPVKEPEKLFERK